MVNIMLTGRKKMVYKFLGVGSNIKSFLEDGYAPPLGPLDPTPR